MKASTLRYCGAIVQEKKRIVAFYDEYGAAGMTPSLYKVTIASKLGAFISSYGEVFRFLSYFLLAACVLVFFVHEL